MEWYVAKTGFEMFDALHAYGLALVLTTGYTMPVTVRDSGLVYSLSTPWRVFLRPSIDIFDALLTLPSLEELVGPSFSIRAVSLPVAIFDGILTVLFSTGARYLSVSDLLRKQRLDTEVVQKGLNKARRAIKRWKDFVSRETARRPDWLTDLLQEYTLASPIPPIPQEGHTRTALTALMTLDPAFTYSLRRPVSDGFLNRKSTVRLSDARYATLLAYIGASRFLRGQQVAGQQVNLYVPLASKIIIDTTTALAPLLPTSTSAQHALVEHLLSVCFSDHLIHEEKSMLRCVAPLVSLDKAASSQPKEYQWKSLAYQVLQTQGGQQSIPYDHSLLDLLWIAALEEREKTQMVRFWQAWLARHGERSPDEQEHLVAALISGSGEKWQTHLCDVVRHAYPREGRCARLYSEEEVKQMITETATPLHVIFEREEGTLRFGRALRQLGRFNRSILRDVIEDLETVQTREQLFRVLYRAMHECVLAKTQYPFIRIPSNADIALLEVDVEQYGVPLVASMLMILSTLRSARPDVDKYDIHTLIAVLLSLSAQLPLIQEEEASDETSTSLEVFSVDEEGEPEV